MNSENDVTENKDNKQSVEIKKPTPASLQVLFAGGASIGTTKKTLTEAVKDAELAYEDVNARSFSFDLENYIQERILEQTRPMLLKTNQYLVTVTDTARQVHDLQNDYYENKQNVLLELGECVRQTDFRAKLAEFQKRVESELDQMQTDLNKQDLTVRKHDDRLDKVDSRIDQADVRMSVLRERVEDVVKYANQVAKRMTGENEKLQEAMNVRFDKLQVTFMDLEAKFEVNTVLLNENTAQSQATFDAMAKHRIENQMWFKQEKANLDRKLKFQKQQQESNLIRMSTRLTDEFIYSCKRLKQKLLYQIGLTDDPWQEKAAFILDDEYSQDQTDMVELVRCKRSNSYDKFTGHGKAHDEQRVVKMPTRVATPQDQSKYRKLMKAQKKFQTAYDKDNLGIPAKKQVGRIDQLKGDPLDYPIVLHTPEKSQKKVQFLDLPDDDFTTTQTGDKDQGRRAAPALAGKGINKGNKAPLYQSQKFKEEKQNWAQEIVVFLRAARKHTFRSKAMGIISAKRDDFFAELDEQDRIYQERKGQLSLDSMKINPHRVQLFSINEIWSCVQARLIELKVMKDPEVDSADSASDSTEMEEDFDFVAVAKERASTLFKGKKKKDGNEKSVAELMRRNDLNLMRRAMDKIVEHEYLLKRNAVLQTTFKSQIKQLNVAKDLLKEFDLKLQEEIKALDVEQKQTNGELVEFRDTYFPEYMDNYSKTVSKEVLKKVYKTQKEIITQEMLDEQLITERNTNIQANIDKLEVKLKEFLLHEDQKVYDHVHELNDKQTNDLITTNEKAVVMDTMLLQHEANFVKDEQEPAPLSQQEMDVLGYYYKHGIMFDADDKLVRMTKKELQIKIFKLNERQHNIDDQMCGIEDSLHMQNDQIKAFNKKLAYNKADTQLLAELNKDKIFTTLDDFKQEIIGIEDVVAPLAVPSGRVGPRQEMMEQSIQESEAQELLNPWNNNAIFDNDYKNEDKTSKIPKLRFREERDKKKKDQKIDKDLTTLEQSLRQTQVFKANQSSHRNNLIESKRLSLGSIVEDESSKYRTLGETNFLPSVDNIGRNSKFLGQSMINFSKDVDSPLKGSSNRVLGGISNRYGSQDISNGIHHSQALHNKSDFFDQVENGGHFFTKQKGVIISQKKIREFGQSVVDDYTAGGANISRAKILQQRTMFNHSALSTLSRGLKKANKQNLKIGKVNLENLMNSSDKIKNENASADRDSNSRNQRGVKTMTEGIITADQSPARLHSERSKNLQAAQMMAAARQNKTLMKRKMLKVNGKQETLRIDSNIKEHEMTDRLVGFSNQIKLPYADTIQPTSRASIYRDVIQGNSMPYDKKDEEKFTKVTKHPQHSMTISGQMAPAMFALHEDQSTANKLGLTHAKSTPKKGAMNQTAYMSKYSPKTADDNEHSNMSDEIYVPTNILIETKVQHSKAPKNIIQTLNMHLKAKKTAKEIMNEKEARTATEYEGF